MKKYIDAEKLIKKFEKMIDDIPASVDSGAGYVIDEVYKIIDTLQEEQPDVDIEKEIEEHTVYMPHGEFASDNEVIEDMEWAKKEFRHFYELGLEAGKKK